MQPGRKPPSTLEALLKWVLAAFFTVDLFLVAPAFASGLGLELPKGFPRVRPAAVVAGGARLADGIAAALGVHASDLPIRPPQASSGGSGGIVAVYAPMVATPTPAPVDPDDPGPSPTEQGTATAPAPEDPGAPSPTPNPEVTQTPSPTLAPSAVASLTSTFVFSPTPTATSLYSQTPIPTSSATSYSSPTATPTRTKTKTATSPPTYAPTAMFTPTRTKTFTPTRTIPPTFNPTYTFTPTLTRTPTPSSTPTPSNTPTFTPTVPTPTPVPDGNYYVSTGGNDNNPGTSSQPWRTIQKAASAMGPGSTVIVLAGDYPERIQVTRSGASGSPITFKAQGTVTMHGFTVKADYISIVGFDISDTPDSSADGVGIYVLGSNCDLEDNYVHFATRGGIVLWANVGQYDKTSNCVVRDNRLYKNGMVGISVMGQDHLVEDNEIWGTIQYHPNWHNPPSWVDADGITFFGSGHTFRHNYIHDIHYGVPENHDPHIDCFQTYAGDKIAGHDILFDANYCDNPDTLPELSLAGKVFQMNDAHDIVIRNNIGVSNLIAIFNSSRGVSIINNTFIGNPDDPDSQGIQLKDSLDFTIENNIFAYQENGVGSIWPDTSSEAGLTAAFNCVYRSQGEPSRPPDPHDIWGLDPLFVDESDGDYHLQSGSPCIDAGLNVGGSVSKDFDGNSRPKGDGYDIGAFER
jgi:hypothetical protein